MLIILALIVGQAQACRMAFLCDDGGRCVACASAFIEAQADDDCCPEQTEEPEECQKCCTLAPLDEHPQTTLKVSVSPTFEMALIDFPALVVPMPALTVWAEFCDTPPYFPHAPPDRSAPRAPPTPAA